MPNATELPSQVFIDISCTIRNIADAIFFVSTAIYFRVMLKRKVFHSNLYTILLFSPLSFIVILVPNIVKDVIQWFTRLSDKQALHIMMVVDFGQFSAGYNLLVLVSERAIATVYVASYENMCAKMPWFAIGLVSLQWAASVILLFLNYNGEVVSSITLVISILIGCMLSATVFTMLPAISKKAYNRELRRQVISIGRYQAVENVRSAKVLRRLVLSTVAAVLLMLAIYSYIRFFIEPNLRPPLYNLHFAIVSGCATFLNLIVLFSHDALRKELLQLTRTERFLNRKVSEVMVRSVSGSRLDVPTAQHTSTYFQTYANIWNQ